MDSGVAWGAVLTIYVLGGAWWTGIFEDSPAPKAQFEDSSLMNAWRIAEAKRFRRSLIWCGGFALLFLACWMSGNLQL
jgi:hypothetical protein